MSDFIFSRQGTAPDLLTQELQQIYPRPPKAFGFQGPWGSLAVTKNLYQGFQPLETQEHLLLIIGGPVLCFRDNRFLTGEDGQEGTRAIYERWLAGELDWRKDLSGPFCVLIVDKLNSKVEVATDLMSFIPLYSVEESGKECLGTHVDALARAAGKLKRDPVGQADFLLHGVVTYPFTTYAEVRQLPPASVHRLGSGNSSSEAYWEPLEHDLWGSRKEAVCEFQRALERYIGSVTEGMDRVGQFLSGGEDSRTVAGLLPQRLERKGFVFLDGRNREGKLAEKAAAAYGMDLEIAFREQDHLLKVLPGASSLVGSASEYLHVHSYGFVKRCGLDSYSAVFGGLYADALFKGSRIRKSGWSQRYKFVPQVRDRKFSPVHPVKHPLFTTEVMEEVNRRHKEHLEWVRTLRPSSAEEWFEMWPSSMNRNIPNIHGNRRLFRSYEPFLSNDLVQLSARTPQEWKLNRRLFQKAVRPYLKPTRWLPHGDGRLPYLSWQLNLPVSFYTFLHRKLRRRLGRNRHDNPWTDWQALQQTEAWKETVAIYAPGLKPLAPLFRENYLSKIMPQLGKFEKFNLLQEMYLSHPNTATSMSA